MITIGNDISNRVFKHMLYNNVAKIYLSRKDIYNVYILYIYIYIDIHK
jgi:hypothetical protein